MIMFDIDDNVSYLFEPMHPQLSLEPYGIASTAPLLPLASTSSKDLESCVPDSKYD